MHVSHCIDLGVTHADGDSVLEHDDTPFSDILGTMSSAVLQSPPKPVAERVFRLSVKQYHAMIEAGVLTEDDPVELIDGILVYKMPKKPRHSHVISKLFKALQGLLPHGYFIRLQDPITLRTGEPEPDLAVVRGDEDDYFDKHPGPDDTTLVIEVADATLRIDRGMKLRSYAKAGIANYWIVDVARRSIEVCSHPNPRQRTYRQRVVLLTQERLPVILNGKQVGQIPVSSILR